MLQTTSADAIFRCFSVAGEGLILNATLNRKLSIYSKFINRMSLLYTIINKNRL